MRLTTPEELEPVLEDFYQKLVQYEEHLKKAGPFYAANKFESLRRDLNETWGEIGPKVVALLGSPLAFDYAGQRFGILDNALRPQTALKALPITLMALPFAKQSIERAKGRLKAGVKTGQPRQKEAPQTRVERAPSNKVFIVHGHDHALLNEVARFVEELGLEPVILKEKPHGGKTLIEKFETYADVSYAVILLTPDDLGRPATPDTAPLRPRARQNAVLEWGFFMGKRGRDRVAVLYKGGVERPTDIEGIAYIPADDAGWKYDLVRELEHAGFTLRTPRA